MRPVGARAGRYILLDEIGSGGMGTVHLARLEGAAGFSRYVAVKTLHPHLAKDSEFLAMFLDEARLAARVRHPNVVATLDVIADADRLLIVMEYVHGVSLAHLARAASEAREILPFEIVTSIFHGCLLGLHAVHEATSETGTPLGMVHRDISPQNILIGADGVTRVIDFGVAKAAGRLHTTKEGTLRGKLGYMSPEQIKGGLITRQVDLYSTAVVLWETLTGRRLFDGSNEGEVLERVLGHEPLPPSALIPAVPVALDDVVRRGLARERKARFGTARQMAAALVEIFPPARADVVGEYVEAWAHDLLRTKSEQLRRAESSASSAPVGLTELARSSGVDAVMDSSPASWKSAPRSVRQRWLLVALTVSLAAFVATAFAARSSSLARRRAVAPTTDPLTPLSAEVPQDLSSASAAVDPTPSASPSASPTALTAGPGPQKRSPAHHSDACKAHQVTDSDGIIHWVRGC